MNFRKLITISITILILLSMAFPLSVKGQELESVYELKDSSGRTSLSIKMKDGQISITARNKVASSRNIIRWETIGYSITRQAISSTTTAKGYDGPGPISDAASSGIARIYFKDADKTWYEEGNDVITTITFSEDKIKEALKDDFSDLKKGTTIYLHSIFQSYRYEDVNGVNTKVIRKESIKNWKDIMNAEYWTSGTLSGFSKFFNMPIKFMPSIQKNTIYYVNQDGNFIAPRRTLGSAYVDEYVSWTNQPASINYYDNNYSLKGYYVTKKTDPTRKWVDEGFISKGKSLNQIRSGKTKVFHGGMEVYLVYEKSGSGPAPPSKGEEPKKESITSNLDSPLLGGVIKGDPKGSEYFDVTKAIPTTESLYTEIESSPYLLGYHFEKKVGTKTYPVKVKKEYILSWYGRDGSEEVPLTSRQTIEEVVNVSRSYGYWQINSFDLYAIDKASINNYALPNEKTTIEASIKDLNLPSVVISCSNLEKDHILLPSEIANGITLKTQTIYGDTSKPTIPKENFTLEADRLIPNLKVKNDSLIIDGQKIIDNSPFELEGSKVDTRKIESIKSQGKIANKGSSLYKDKLIIGGTKKNGLYSSSGKAEYKRIVSHSSKYNEKLEYNISNINSVVIHTPVVCKPIYSSDNESFVQLDKIPPGLNLVLDTDKQTNDFKLQISNNEFHTNIKGYGKRDYTYSLRDKKTSYIAASNGQLRNEVKFPFDIYHYDKKGTKKLIEKDTWIILSSDSHEFSLPIWVNEGSYNATCRSIALNADLSKLDQISEKGANTKLSNYVATASIYIEVSGRMYGLTIYDISDYPVWEDVFRISDSLLLKANHGDVYQDGTRYETYQKRYRYDYRVGTKDQYGNQTARLSKYTLPLVDGSHPRYLNQGILKTGYGVRFKLTSLGSMYSEGSQIIMKPRFYHVDKDGKNRREVDLYYEETIGDEIRHLVKVSSSLDDINMKFQEVGSPYVAIPTSELENTAKISKKNYQDLLGRREGLFTFANIQISSVFRTFPEKDSKYIQNWYGYYYLPSILYAVPKGYGVYNYARKHGINFHENFWLNEGYIIVNMDIRSVDDYGKDRLSYFNKDDPSNPNNMWNIEGYSKKKVSSSGVEFEFEQGDFIIYKLNSSVLEDYRFDGL